MERERECERACVLETDTKALSAISPGKSPGRGHEGNQLEICAPRSMWVISAASTADPHGRSMIGHAPGHQATPYACMTGKDLVVWPATVCLLGPQVSEAE